MTKNELIEGLRTLNAPNQGMQYFGGGFDHDGPRFDTTTGERLSPRHRPATLHLNGDRARFIYRLIESSAALADELAPAQPQQPSSLVAGTSLRTMPDIPHPLDTVSEAARRQLVRAAGWIEKEAYDASGDDDPKDNGLDEAASFLRSVFDLSDEALGIRRNASDEIIFAGQAAPKPDTLAEGLEVVHFQYNEPWSSWEHVIPEAAGRDGVVGFTPHAEATRLLAERDARIAELTTICNQQETQLLGETTDRLATEADVAKLREALEAALLDIKQGAPGDARWKLQKALAQTKGRP